MNLFNFSENSHFIFPFGSYVRAFEQNMRIFFWSIKLLVCWTFACQKYCANQIVLMHHGSLSLITFLVSPHYCHVLLWRNNTNLNYWGPNCPLLFWRNSCHIIWLGLGSYVDFLLKTILHLAVTFLWMMAKVLFSSNTFWCKKRSRELCSAENWCGIPIQM